MTMPIDRIVCKPMTRLVDVQIASAKHPKMVKGILFVAFACLHCACAFSCEEAFGNITALIYRDKGSDYSLNTITNHRLDWQRVYKVEIEPINSIQRLCKNAISNFPELTSLSLIYNGIEYIEPGAFINVPALKELHLSYNQIQVISPGIFNNLSLTELYLTGNKIYTIDKNAFNNMTQLRVLDLSFNFIQFLDANWFHNSRKITTLNFVFNLISTIPENSFINLAGVPQEIELLFLNNTISYIHEGAFRGLKKLNKLSLGSNLIKSLHENTFIGIEGIDTLQLQNNELQCFDDVMLRNLKAGEIYLAGNPLVCNCMYRIEKWGDFTNTKVFNGKENLDRCGLKSRNQEITTVAPEGIPVDL